MEKPAQARHNKSTAHSSRFVSHASSPSSSRQTNSRSRNRSTDGSPRHWSCHPLRRAITSNPVYSMMLSVYSPSALRLFHHEIQLRMMDLHTERWYDEAFPEPMRPLINEALPELVKYIFTDRGAFYKFMTQHIKDAKDGKSDVQLILVKPLPPQMVTNDVVWNYNIAPHCRFMYLEVQKTVIIHIAKETRYIETMPSEHLIYDDSDNGVQGHALSRIRYTLKKQLSNMGISEDEYDFLFNSIRQSPGVRAFPDDPAEFDSIHSCDRAFVPRHESPRVDARGSPWPTMVIESGPAYTNAASRKYLQFCVDWWFTQSDSVTKTVLLMFFDYKTRETVFEKWVRNAEPPFHKTLEQTIVINIQINHEAKTPKDHIVVSSEGMTLSLESLMRRPRREGETDIILDKALLTGLANGYLLPWPNFGPDRKQVVRRLDIDKYADSLVASATSAVAAVRRARSIPDRAARAAATTQSLDQLSAIFKPAIGRLALDAENVSEAKDPQVDENDAPEVAGEGKDADTKGNKETEKKVSAEQKKAPKSNKGRKNRGKKW